MDMDVDIQIQIRCQAHINHMRDTVFPFPIVLSLAFYVHVYPNWWYFPYHLII